LFYTPLQLRGCIGAFDQAVSDYVIERVRNPSSPADFATFLAERDFQRYFDASAAAPQETPIPQPASTPTPHPANSGIPADGEILYNHPLSEWNAESYDIGWTEPSSTSLHIGVYGSDGEHVIEAWTDRNDFADISASVDVREISDHAAAAGCISIRHDVAAGDYSYCILGNGRSWATHNYVDANGEWQTEVLLDDQVREGMRESTEWNTLKVVAKGNRLWFILYDTVHATVTHDARTAGDVAVAVTNWDVDQDAEFEFKNLVVRDVE
jgi:hypothetical protein